MDKVLVEIFLPAANKTFDVFLPRESKMSDITVMVSQALSRLSQDKYKYDESSVLCDAVSGNIYNINLSVYELGIKNGARLMLI